MKSILLLLLVTSYALAVPTMEDNKLPTDQELMGQPEEVSSLGLPSDEESFNHLSVFFNPPKPSAPITSGTYHFVSSTFPVDARGFHESVFDGIGDYFPSWPAPYKRENTLPFTPSLAQRLGLRPRSNLRKRSETWEEPVLARKKRVVPHSHSSLEDLVKCKEKSNDSGGVHCSFKTNTIEALSKRLAKRDVHAEEELEEKGGNKKTVNDRVVDDSYFNSNKRSGARYVRGMEMGSSGFHGDVFNGDFGDFTTMRKRARGSPGFHGDTFSDGFGDFATMKRALKKKRLLSKLKDYLWSLTDQGGLSTDTSASEPSDLSSEIPHSELDDLYAIKKRKPEMTSMGFHGDTFSGGFGDFYTVKKRRPEMDSMGFHGDTFSRGFGDFDTFKKRRPATGSMGFHGDTFSQGFGDFDTYKKRKLEMDSMGFHGDTFSRGFGDFESLKKRRPEMDSMGFHGDTFSRGFGDFEPFKKRRPMGSMGFHGDTFSQGFGDFDTYKKRRAEMDSMGFHGDTFSRGFGDFEPLKKRRPMGSMGFHGDTFSQGFGDFDTYKKRRAEMDSMGFHGDTFNRGFGDFDVYKKRSTSRVPEGETYNQNAEAAKTEDKKCCLDSSIQRHEGGH